LRRFIIPPHAVRGDTVTITGDLFHHMARVLRLKKGARLSLSDGNGHEYMGFIDQLDGESLAVKLEEASIDHAAESGPKITLFQGLAKGDKLELIIQKSTELGVAEIVPFVAARSVSRPAAGRIQEKLERWRRIALEAARQSRRMTVPQVTFAADLSEVCRQADHPVKLLLWEEEQTRSLRMLLAGIQSPQRIAVIVGPEGGLTSEEVACALKCGFISVSLGKRIVRTETAGLAILAILQFHWGDIG
jgi:16S rRNA (uracil1498-N3)-methyltransferase